MLSPRVFAPRIGLAALTLAFGTALGIGAFDAAPARALAGDRDLSFPDFAAGIRYATVDRADIMQYRELYAPASAIAAIKAGKPLPAGTVLTMLIYTARHDGTGTPLADADGRLIKDQLLGYLVMERRGDAEPASTASAIPWRFQVFRPDKSVAGVKLSDCAACHEKRRSDDFVFTRERMRTFSREPPSR